MCLPWTYRYSVFELKRRIELALRDGHPFPHELRVQLEEWVTKALDPPPAEPEPPSSQSKEMG